MAFTQITTSNLDNTITTKLAAAEAANAAVANIVSLAISSVQIADSSYNVIDDTAANTGGGYLVINGTGFTNQCVVIVGTTNATSTTFANTKQLRAQVSGLAAATYPLYVVDSVTGATAIKVNGLTYSSFPAWSTGSSLSNQAANTSFSVNLSANSDSAITYSNTTALPAGTTLAANGLFSGTVTIGAQTTYSFDVKATDAENQDTSRTFSLTVTVTPPSLLYVAGAVNRLLENSADKSSPTQVGTDNWTEITKSGQQLQVQGGIKRNGTLWTWGTNGYGSSGQNIGTFGLYSSPVQVGTGTDWSKITVTGAGAILAMKTNGTLWGWGDNNAGVLGINSQGGGVSSPTQIGASTNWSKICGCSVASAAIKTDGTLWTWGSNDSGQLGLGNIVNRSSPTQVGSATNWTEIGSWYNGFFGIKTDGTLWAWGSNVNGQLAQNSRLNSFSNPTQIGVATNWSKLIAQGASFGAATKTDGTLWLWGGNGYGQLGQGDRAYRSNPVQLGTGTDWLTGSSTYAGILVIKTNGTLWAWGKNNDGSLGINSTIHRSSPVQVGSGTTWSNVYSTQNAAYLIRSD